MLELLQKAVAYQLLVSEGGLDLAVRHQALGLQYLEMGWAAAALAQVRSPLLLSPVMLPGSG